MTSLVDHDTYPHIWGNQGCAPPDPEELFAPYSLPEGARQKQTRKPGLPSGGTQENKEPGSPSGSDPEGDFAPYSLPEGAREREFFIDNLLVRIHFIIEMIIVDWQCAMGV